MDTWEILAREKIAEIDRRLEELPQLSWEARAEERIRLLDQTMNSLPLMESVLEIKRMRLKYAFRHRLENQP